jgi:hypothetical protein
MPLVRRLALLAVVAAGFAVLSGPASAASVRDGSLPFSVDSTNFRVHYQSDGSPATAPSAITETQAGDIAALAERALTAELADGYPTPLSDGVLGGDGKIDIYVEDYSATPGVLATALWDTDALTSSGFIELAGNMAEEAFTQQTIAHELFHLVQFSMWLPRALWAPTGLSDAWLLEASAEWMAFRVDGYPLVSSSLLGPSDMALDCRDPLGGTSNKCDLTDDYLGNGYSRWPFFEYLSEKYGAAFVKDVFAQGLAGDPGSTAISSVAAALTAKGTTLADAYNAWARTELTSSYSIAALQAVKPRPYGAPIFTGVLTGPVTSQKVAVNHLATRYLQFTRGRSVGGTVSGICWKATLAISVTIPAGTLSQPVFYWDGATTSTVPLSVDGNKATASVPWDTCTWADGEGFLSLPNASQAVDAADFDVSASLSVDFTTQVTSILPALPPPPVVTTSPVIAVSSADVAPTIEVFGPQLLKLSASDSQIRLIVNASGQGLVSAALGSLALGTVNLRAGNNDLRFNIPKGTLTAVRRSASLSNVLTLTPTATNGAAIGKPVTRTFQIAASKTTLAKKTPTRKAPAKKAPAKKTPTKKAPHTK